MLSEKRNVILFTAMSIDGYIARPGDDLNFLDDLTEGTNSDFGFEDFLDGIETTIMGRGTYDFIEKACETTLYEGKENWVFTKNKPSNPLANVQFQDSDPVSFVQSLKAKEGKDIWLVGGGKLNSTLFAAGLVDKLHIHLFPAVLSAGVKLSDISCPEQYFTLESAEILENGIVELQYHKRYMK
jgi:dihydrofolate reductase